MDDREPSNDWYQFRRPHSSDDDDDDDCYSRQWRPHGYMSEINLMQRERAEMEAVAAKVEKLCNWHEARIKAVMERLARSSQQQRIPPPRPPASPRKAPQPSMLTRMRNVLAPVKSLQESKRVLPSEPVVTGDYSREYHIPSPPLSVSASTMRGRRNHGLPKNQRQQRSPERRYEANVWENEAMQTHLREQAWKVAEKIATDNRSISSTSSSSVDSITYVDTWTPVKLQGYLEVRNPAEVSSCKPAFTPRPPAAALHRSRLPRPVRMLSLPKAASIRGQSDKQAASGLMATDNRSQEQKPMTKVKDQSEDQFQVRLQPLADPEESLELTLKLLSYDNWRKKMDGLKLVRALAQHHAEVLEADLHQVCSAVTQEVQNLRSAVSRAAMATLRQMYTHLQRAMDSEAEYTAGILLLKVGQSNTFIQEQANLALEAMVQNCSPVRVTNALLNGGLSHKSAAARASAALHFCQLTDIIGVDRVLAAKKTYIERFLVAVSKMSLDSAAEVRHHGRIILQRLALHSHFPKLWAQFVPQKDQQSLQKFIGKMNYRRQ